MPFIRANEAGKLSRPSKFGTTRPFLSDDRVAELLDMKAEDDAQNNFNSRFKQKWDSMVETKSTVIKPAGAESLHNVSTNTPALSDATGAEGQTYRVSVAGTRNYGSGDINLNVGDYLIHWGSVWQKADIINGPPNPWSVPAGYVDPEEAVSIMTLVNDDITRMVDLAFRWCILGDANAAKGAAAFLNAYSNLTFLSAYPDRVDGSRLQWSSRWPCFIQAAMMISDSEHYTEALHGRLQTVTQNGLILSTGTPAQMAYFNWSGFGLVHDFAVATFLNDRALFNAAITRWCSAVDQQLKPLTGVRGTKAGVLIQNVPYKEVFRQQNQQGDGSYGLYYSMFALNGLTVAAEWARIGGEYLYDYVCPTGQSFYGFWQTVASWMADPGDYPFNTSGTVPTEISRLQGFVDILHSIWPEVLDGLDPSTNAATPFLPDVMRTKTTTQDYYGFRGGILGYRDRRLCFNY
jgi:hypothetical protein